MLRSRSAAYLAPCVMLCALVPAQDRPRFRRSEIEVSQALHERILWDANADHRVDLVLYRAGKLALHLQSGAGEFSAEPTREIALPNGTTLFGFGDLDQDGRLDFLAHTQDGFRALRVVDGANLDIDLPDTAHSLFRSASELAPHMYWHFLHNLADAPRDELLVPLRNGFELYELCPPHRRGFLACHPQSRARLDPPGLEARLRVRSRVPPVAFVAREDASELFALSRGRKLELYEWQMLEHRLEPTLVSSIEVAASAEEGETFFAPTDRNPEMLDQASCHEIDGDGWPDLVRYDAEARSFAFLYGQRGSRRVEVPDSILRIAARPTRWRLQDLDGDRRAELILYEEQDVKAPVNALRAWLGGASKSQITIFRLGATSRSFEPYPCYRGSYALRTELGSKRGNFELALRYIVNMDGDFDGDGFLDLVTQPADEVLEIRRGLSGGTFAESPWFRLTIPSDAAHRDVICQTNDLDGDGRADLLLHYRGWDKSPAESLVMWVQELR